MAVWTTYDQVGLAEDVSDIISNITPTKTPFQSMIGSEKVSARLFEWQEDSLRAVQTNAQLEGFTASEASLTATTMRSNYTQILEKTIKISGTSDAVKMYGRKKETAYQLAKAAEEVKRDLENAMVGVAQAAVAGSAGVARQFASALNQISASTTEAGGTAAITETKILNCQDKIYDEGGDASVLMIKPSDSVIIAGFTGVANARSRVVNDGSKKLVNAVEVYVSPYGELKVVLNRFLKTTHALLFDPSNWKKCVLRNWTRTLLAKTGDNDMHMLVGEFSLKHLNQKASGMIDALT
jgi:hypothetical protein